MTRDAEWARAANAGGRVGGEPHRATVHLVYPHGTRISCPDAIGRNLGIRLATRYRVRHHAWDATTVIRPAPGDVLVGHPHPMPWTVFRRSARLPGWRRVLALSPYHHGDDVQVAYLDAVVGACDLYLAITGPHWFTTVGDSTFAHWLPKMRHVDLAVDRADFPRLDRDFNPPGQRRFVYIGGSGWTKNTEYLSAIARAMPETQFGWIGSGAPIEGLMALGHQDFATAGGRRCVADHDFLITVGRADANPTTILEAMAWGLIPVCTPQSGYDRCVTIPNVPLDDVAGAVRVLTAMQRRPGSELDAMQAANWDLLDAHFTWDRVAAQVVDGIESSDSPPLAPASLGRRVRIRRAALRSPYAPWRPRNLAAAARAALKR